MANVIDTCFSAFISRQLAHVLLFISLAHSQNSIVFQPSFLFATGPAVSAFVLGNISEASLHLRTVSASNSTGSVGSPTCVTEPTQWILSTEQMGRAAAQIHLRLNRSLYLCNENDTDTECCPKLLCVLETLQLSACVRSTPQASLLIQATIYAQLFPDFVEAGSHTVIPNQVFQPLGSCPCDLTLRVCDVRCCCDENCNSEDLKLFASDCLPGPFGGQISPAPDYQCSMQASENSPDWFPFLCVNSPPENNPYLGLFYQGDTIASQPYPSFQMPMLSASEPLTLYVQGSPIVMVNKQYFTIPQKLLGWCGHNAPVAFLKDFTVECVTELHSCPTAPPLQTQLTDFDIPVMNGIGGEVMVDVADELAPDIAVFISESGAVASADKELLCENVTLALDYKFYWRGNSIKGITVTRTVGTIKSNGSMALTTRYSAVFLNGEFIAEPNSGNPGYQVGRPVITGIVDNNTESVQKTSLNIWKPVRDGLCSTAEKKTVLYGENSTSGCLLPIRKYNWTQCNGLREMVSDLQGALFMATHVAKHGKPNLLTMTDWVNISYVTLNSSTLAEDTGSTCSGIPVHQHIQIWSVNSGLVEGIPQSEISALQISYTLSTWTLDCEGYDASYCEETQLFPITSSVTFIDIPINLGPPKTRFQINFTEYDCNRNDVCWPELAFPITRYYTGEPYSHALAKGIILIFFVVTASLLGTPWKQIRQLWHSAAIYH